MSMPSRDNTNFSISTSDAEATALIPPSTPLHQSLSDREFQVMCMFASGKTNGQVAQALSLSVKTITTYRSRILEKMNLKNNAEMTHYAIKNRLVE
jgi:DNA-binding NarL/FixJ family response regulator